MKNIKRLYAIILTLALAMGLCVPAMAAVEDTGFSDVTADAWYAEAAVWCRDNGIMSGTSGTAFSPDTTMTRAMLAAVLYRAAGSPAVTGSADFSDVAANAYYNRAANWASANGIISGYGNRRFGSNDPVTREQIAAILWRYDGSPAAGRGTDFADESSIASYAGQAVDWARAEGIISGMDGNRFVPQGQATRAQVAVILHRYLTRGAAVTPPADTTQPGHDTSGSKILIAYFSRAGENYNVGVVEKGNTAIVAEMIAEKTGGNLFEIRPTTPYPSDYNEMLEIARQESSQNARPEMADSVTNMADYDVVFLGYPIWNGDMPMIVYNFLETYDLSGKTVLPFSTNEGSGLAGTQGTITSKCSNATVLDGLAMRGQTAQNDRSAAEQAVESWLKDSGILDRTPSTPNTPSQNTSSTDLDLEKGTVTLNNGIEMPILGIGTYTLSNQQAENSVYWALRDGYRLIDTARIYGNEEGVGRGIQRAIDEGLVTREEIFVTTKMWTSDFGNGAAAIDASLRRLNLDYIDLMILHHSQPSNDVDAYKSMEQAVSEGKLRSIGLSNYYTAEDFDRLVNATTITPALLQNETHPHYQSTAMKEHLKQYGTVLESWFPLGGRGHTQELFNDPTISSIAAAHGKTSAQVLLRWHLQAGNIAIPGSSNEAHIAENFDIFDFELTDAEMQRIAAMDQNRRHASY